MHDYKPAEHDYSAKISSQSAFVRLNARFFCSSCSYSDKRAFTMTIDRFRNRSAAPGRRGVAANRMDKVTEWTKWTSAHCQPRHEITGSRSSEISRRRSGSRDRPSIPRHPVYPQFAEIQGLTRRPILQREQGAETPSSRSRSLFSGSTADLQVAT